MVDAHALDGFVGEVERNLDEQAIIRQGLKDILKRAKNAGFVPAFVRLMAKERRMEQDDRDAKYRTEAEYRTALGMFADTPLGEAAMGAAHIERPTPFAAQPVHDPAGKRGRRKPVLFDQEHPQGTA
jgi:uncharacterized protein (UPF0335 family)